MQVTLEPSSLLFFSLALKLCHCIFESVKFERFGKDLSVANYINKPLIWVDHNSLSKFG